MQSEFEYRYVSTAWLKSQEYTLKKGKDEFLKYALFHEKFMRMVKGNYETFNKNIVEYRIRKHKENIEIIKKYIEKRSTTKERWQKRKILREIKKEDGLIKQRRI